MDDIGAITGWARVGDGGFVAASVADELVVVGVESQGEETGGTEGLPTAFFANR